MTAKMYFIALLCLWLTLPGIAQLIHHPHQVESHGLDLHVNEFGQTGKTETKHILLVHGLTYSSHEFHIDYKDYSLVNFLSKNGYQVWTMDITGYGQSQKPADGFIVNTSYAAEDIAAVIKYIREKVNINQLDLLGWSWGTATTSRLVASHASWIRKLVLYAPVTSGYNGDAPKQDWHQNTWAHAASDFQLKDKIIDYKITEKPVVALFLSNCWKFDQEVSPNGGRKDLMKGSAEKFILPQNLVVPTLFIGGDRDPYLKWEEIESIYQNHPKKAQSQLIRIRGGAHALMMEKPYYKQFQKKVLLFLQP
ncbi:alpha/beta hydrolase [Fulvivirgaceae bacterium BMA12]|uniref:Alpha/beta hydrolase n=1 Tax=Agaribacillus aureus TaxID=3051825 RepID=A0ABT8LC42_9BACT|nr:alpha/beta hydrolase [Fulvivirgaceae bacterium BMA12]